MENKRFGLRYPPHYLASSMVFTRLLREVGDGETTPDLGGGIDFDDDADGIIEKEKPANRPEKVELEPDFMEMVRALGSHSLRQIQYLGILDFDGVELAHEGLSIEETVRQVRERMQQDINRLLRKTLRTKPFSPFTLGTAFTDTITVGFSLTNIDPLAFNATLARQAYEGGTYLSELITAEPVNLLSIGMKMDLAMDLEAAVSKLREHGLLPH